MGRSCQAQHGRSLISIDSEPVSVVVMAALGDDMLAYLASGWMKHAIAEAQVAMDEGEVPVGAIFVAHPRAGASFDFTSGEMVASGHNLTNKTRNVRNYRFGSYILEAYARLIKLTTILSRPSLMLSIWLFRTS